MHKRTFCQTLFNKALDKSIHAKRKNCLVRFLSDLMDYDTTLSVTEIGKKLSSKSTLKSKINTANTFISNEKFAKDIGTIYQGLAHFFFAKMTKLLVLVDWSGACHSDYHMLTATVVGHGRSIPLYHEVHTAKDQEKEEVHQTFLSRLKEIIPAHCQVTLITDAGFHRNWFEQVLTLGWHVIGRVYSRYYYEKDNQWSSTRDILFDKAGQATALGKIKLGKTKKPLEGYLYSYKETLRNRVNRKKNPYPSHDKAHSDYYKNGWIIFSSLDKPAQEIIQLYKKRMQIEQNFKDIKNISLGFGLRRHASSGKVRISMLSFLANLLSLIAWWVGLMIESCHNFRSFQANTIKNRRVRSFIHLARLAFRHEPTLLHWPTFCRVIVQFKCCYFSFVETGKLIWLIK